MSESPYNAVSGRERKYDAEALSRALTAFCEAYGHGITWAEVLPLVKAASTVEDDPERDGVHEWLTAEDDRRPASYFADRFREDHWPR